MSTSKSHDVSYWLAGVYAGSQLIVVMSSIDISEVPTAELDGDPINDIYICQKKLVNKINKYM